MSRVRILPLVFALTAVAAALYVVGPFGSDTSGDVSGDTRPSVAQELTCCPAGYVGVLVNADSDFDPVVQGADQAAWQMMRSLYEGMIVWRPYFDPYSEEFPAASVYLDIFALYAEAGRDERPVDHPDWILRDGEGTPLYIDWGCDEPEGCPQYAADIGSRAFRDDMIQRIESIREDGYSGVHLDDVNMDWRIAYRDGDDGRPTDPRTGQEMTLEDWRRYMAELTEEIRDAFPDMTISHNVIWYSDSPRFDDPYIDRQIASADFIMLERGANDSGLESGDGEFGFRTFLGFSDRVHELGSRVLFFDQRAETDEEQWYNLASLLLVSNGSDMVTTSDDERLAPATYWEGFDVDLGSPRGARGTIGDLLTRSFEDGLVLVNEPDADGRRVELSAPMNDQGGLEIRSITLQSSGVAVLSGASGCVDIEVFSEGGDDALETMEWCPGG